MRTNCKMLFCRWQYFTLINASLTGQNESYCTKILSNMASIPKVVQCHPVPFATVSFADHDGKINSRKNPKSNFTSDANVDLTALDGLRAISCFTVVCFHCLLYWAMLQSWKDSNQVLVNGCCVIKELA